VSRSLRRVLVFTALVALLAAAAVPVQADPADVYTDFVNTGKLRCDHPRSDLEAVLNDAVLDQYGNPLVLAKLKRLIRKDLANGCFASGSSTASSGTATSAAAAGGGSGGGDGGSLIGAPEILAGLAIVAVAAVGFFGRRRLPARR
jgi:hypothetical protein